MADNQSELELYDNAHKAADLDTTTMSLHHSLGPSATQASPGNHNHDTKYSGITHNHDTDYAPIDIEDEGSVIQVLDTAPIKRPNNTPLELGDLWVDPRIVPALEWYQGIWLSPPGGTEITLGAAGAETNVPGVSSIVFTAPCDGVLEILASAYYKASVTTGYTSLIIIGVGTKTDLIANNNTDSQPQHEWDHIHGHGAWFIPKDSAVTYTVRYYSSQAVFVIRDLQVFLTWRPFAVGAAQLNWSS